MYILHRVASSLPASATAANRLRSLVNNQIIATPSFATQIRTMSADSIPKTIKAIRVSKTGGPEVNELLEIPTPVPNEDEVLIKVEYSGVNFIDTYFRTGLYPRALPYTVGQDAIGTVVTLPKSYTPPKDSPLPPLKIGQRVLTTSGNSFAEYLAAPIAKVAPFPENLNPEEGVALGVTAFTALALINESYKVKKGDWVLVRAAAGGVGIILVQLAHALGAHVIGTVSTEAKAELVKTAGADHVLLTTNSSEDNVKKLLEITDGKGVHVVYDGVGKDTWDEDFEVIRRLGTIVTYGNASGPVPAFAPLKLVPKSLKVTRPSVNTIVVEPEEFIEYAKKVFDAVESGALKVKVHKVYGFSAEEVAQAQKDITSRATTGKLVIKIGA